MSASHPNDWSPIPPTEAYVFKPVEKCQFGGPRAVIWLPDESTVKDKTAGAPLSIMIHGGAFTGGGGYHIPMAQARYWLSQGHIVASLEYRMLPHVDLTGCRADVLDGYRWLVDGNLESSLSKSGHAIKPDVNKSVCFGGSAGGTLTVLLAVDIDAHNTSHPTAPIPQLRALISAYPLADPNNQMRATKSEFYESMKAENPEDLKIVEGLIEEDACVSWDFPRKRGPSTDPRAIWLRTTFHYKAHNSFLCGQEGPPYADVHCCTKSITPTLPPLFILAAGSDDSIPKTQSYDLRDAYLAKGLEVHLKEAEGAPHAFVEIPMGWRGGVDWWEAVILPALEWADGKVKSA